MIVTTLRTAGRVKTVGLVIAGATLALGVVVSPPDPLTYDIQLVLAVFVASVVLWITKPVPYTVSSILCIVLLYGLNLAASFAEAASGFASSLIIFFILLLLIGKSVASVGLDDWVANRLVSATSTPRASVRRLSITVLFMSFLMPSSFARTVTFMPVIDRINGMYGLGEESQFRRLSYYVIGHVNPLASMTVMTGGGMAIVTAELINSLVRPFTWIEWFLYMTPPTVLLFLGLVFVADRFHGVNDESLADDAPVQSNSDRLSHHDSATPNGGEQSTEWDVEPLNTDQLVVLGMLLIAIVLWVVGSFVGIPAIIPAMLVVFVFSLPWFRIITPEEIRSLSWGIIFLLASMLSLIEVMDALDAFDLLVDLLFSTVPVHEFGVVMIALLFVIAVAVRGTFSSVSAAIIVFLPILIEVGQLFALDELYLSLALMMILATTVFVPFNIPPVLVAYNRGPLTNADVLKLGLLTLSFGAVVVALSWGFYWPIVDRATAGLF